MMVKDEEEVEDGCVDHSYSRYGWLFIANAVAAGAGPVRLIAFDRQVGRRTAGLGSVQLEARSDTQSQTQCLSHQLTPLVLSCHGADMEGMLLSQSASLHVLSLMSRYHD